ncbi:glutaredoxin family protein [Fundidesulfovibrio butyratiphilus]
MSQKNVKLYALSTCIHCKNCKEYLDSKNLQYECIYVDQLTGDERNKLVEEIKKINPTLSFPTVLIGQEVVVGFDKDKIESALRK